MSEFQTQTKPYDRPDVKNMYLEAWSIKSKRSFYSSINTPLENMRIILFCLILALTFGNQHVYGQCDFVTPPAVKKINTASREVTFSNVTINGKSTTYLAVQKGETVKISTTLSSKKNGDYCPACIVQIYWGIRGHTSVCANSFYGYQFKSKNSTHEFRAPLEDGIYYITMGQTLDYSCKNNVFRPTCSPDDAFAVLKVGNPDPEKKITLAKVQKGSIDFLKTTMVKQGCFGKLDKIEWFLQGEKLAFDNQEEIPITASGTYKVVWSNCLESITDTFTHTAKDKNTVNAAVQEVAPAKGSVVQGTIAPGRVVQGTVVQGTAVRGSVVQPTVVVQPPLEVADTPTQPDETDIADLVSNNNSFVLKNLIFDLSQSIIKPEAQKDLDQLAQIMKYNPKMRILLEGHTDKRGSAKKNQILSEQRVEATKSYLIDQGVLESNIETKGWGDKKPLIITRDIEEGKINRRVEIQILAR